MARSNPLRVRGYRKEAERLPAALPASCLRVRGLQLPAAPTPRACALVTWKALWLLQRPRLRWLKRLNCRLAAARAYGPVLFARDSATGPRPGRSPLRYALGKESNPEKSFPLYGKLRPKLASETGRDQSLAVGESRGAPIALLFTTIKRWALPKCRHLKMNE